jgi:hypothetical protein
MNAVDGKAFGSLPLCRWEPKTGVFLVREPRPRGLAKLTGLQRELFLSFRAGGIDMAPPGFDWEPEGDHEEDHRVVHMVLDGNCGRRRGLMGISGSLLINVLHF